MDAACGQRHPRENGQPLRIELSFIGTDALSKSMAEIIQADMRQIGADVSLIGEEESSIYARQRDGRFGMIFHRTRARHMIHTPSSVQCAYRHTLTSVHSKD